MAAHACADWTDGRDALHQAMPGSVPGSTRTNRSRRPSCARRSMAAGSTASAARSQTRRSQIGTGDRSQRIRTYNFPQGRVTDHRIGLTLHSLDLVLEGRGLDEIIDALITEHQTSLLAAVQEEGHG